MGRVGGGREKGKRRERKYREGGYGEGRQRVWEGGREKEGKGRGVEVGR